MVVLGLGPGGEHVAIKLARAGLDVVGVEDRLVGGECPYYGCVPSKMMIAAAHVVAAARRVPDFGGTATVEPDWSDGRPPDPRRGHRRLGRHGRGQAARGQRRPFRPRPRRAGRARTGPASAARRTSPARASCSTPAPRPAAPPIDGLAGTPYWTNRDAVTVTELPASLVVLGGGADRLRARPGVRAVRRRRHRRRGGRPPGRGRGARGLRGPHPGVRRRGHRGARRRHGRLRDP